MGKESIPAQSSCHMASIELSHGEGGWESLTHSQLEAAKIEWQVANTPFANHQGYMKTRLHVSTQNCQPTREYQFEFANLEKEACQK